MKNVERILDWRGKVLGTIETDKDGNKCVKNFYGKVLGRYTKRTNTTTDFYGRKVAQGDQCAMLLSLK